MGDNKQKRMTRIAQAGSGSELTIGVRLKDARNQVGLTIRDLAAESAVGESTIQKYESGKSLPGAGELRRLCDALDLDAHELIFGKKKEGGRSLSAAAFFDAEGRDDVYVAKVGAAMLALPDDDRDAMHQLLASNLVTKMGRERFQRLEIVASDWITKLTVDASAEPLGQIWMSEEDRADLRDRMGLKPGVLLDAPYEGPRTKGIREALAELESYGKPDKPSGS